MEKEKQNYKLYKTYVSRKNGVYYKNLLYYCDNGKIIKKIKEISDTNKNQLPNSNPLNETLESFEILLKTLFKSIINENSYKIFQLKCNDIDYYIEKIYKLTNEKITEDTNKIICNILKKSYNIAKEKAPNRELLKDALNYILKNTKLNEYEFIDETHEL